MPAESVPRERRRRRERAARRPESPAWWLVPLALLGLLVAWKLTFLARITAGFMTYDEIIYFKYASILAQGRMYAGTEYPWLYPLAIVPAFLFRDPHVAAVALSAVYSSLLVFPVWLIARELLGVRHAAVVTALSCLLPYHYVLGRTIMSEQIYYPMLLFAIYLAWTRRWDAHPLPRDLLTGVLLGAMYATRYLTVPVVPAIVFAWLIRERDATGRWLLPARAWLRLALAVAAGLAVFAPWVVAAEANGASGKAALGLGIASSKLAASVHPTFAGLLMYAGLYLAAWALSLAPVLGGLALAGIRAVREKERDQLTRLALSTGVLALGLLVILTRHSWLATYNYPVPERIMVRYAIYLAGLGLIVGYAAVVRYTERFELRGATVWLAAFVLPAAAAALAWWATFGSGVMPDAAATIDGSAGDVYRVSLMGGWFWLVALATLAVVAWLLARRRAAAIAVLALGIALFLVAGIPAYFERLDRLRAYEILAYRVATIERAARGGNPKTPLTAVVDPTVWEVAGMPERQFVKSFGWNLSYLSQRAVEVRIAGELPRPDYEILGGPDRSGTATETVIDGRTYSIVRMAGQRTR